MLRFYVVHYKWRDKTPVPNFPRGVIHQGHTVARAHNTRTVREQFRRDYPHVTITKIIRGA